MKKDSQLVLRYIPLRANTERVDEMDNDMERILTSEIQHCKFSIQLNESTFDCSNMLMVYVKCVQI